MKNSKSLFFAILLLTFGLTTYGQTNKFYIGVDGGPSLIFLRGSKVIDNHQKSAIGFSGGLFFQFNFKNVISLRTNVAFERKGGKFTAPATDNNGTSIGELTACSSIDYLTLPVLVRATFGNKIQYFINAGPYFGYLLRDRVVVKGDNILTFIGDYTASDKRFDTGISTGLGLSVPLNKNLAVSFEIRNNLGLYNISAYPIDNNGTIKTNSTNGLFSFTYKLGQRI
ncbi:MAG: porin family protein [Bacteroidia bacterium]